MDIFNRKMEIIKSDIKFKFDDSTRSEIDRKMRCEIRSHLGAYFFEWAFNSQVQEILDLGNAGDLSYFEYITNKTYLDPLSENNIFSVALAAFDTFSSHWSESVRKDVDIVLLFQVGGEFGDLAAISFNLHRAGLPVFYERNVELFNSPILLRRLRF